MTLAAAAMWWKAYKRNPNQRSGLGWGEVKQPDIKFKEVFAFIVMLQGLWESDLYILYTRHFIHLILIPILPREWTAQLTLVNPKNHKKKPKMLFQATKFWGSLLFTNS